MNGRDEEAEGERGECVGVKEEEGKEKLNEWLR